MPFATRGNLVWLGMILSGIALGFYVFASWPDTSPQVIRLPYGEALPKTPRAAAPVEKAKVVAEPAAPDAELTVAEPAPMAVPERVPASPPPAEEAVAAESAYELGAEPLPGMGPAKPKPAEQKKAAATPPPAQAPAAEPTPAPAPEPAPEEPPIVEIIIGSAPPSGQG